MLAGAKSASVPRAVTLFPTANLQVVPDLPFPQQQQQQQRTVPAFAMLALSKLANLSSHGSGSPLNSPRSPSWSPISDPDLDLSLSRNPSPSYEGEYVASGNTHPTNNDVPAAADNSNNSNSNSAHIPTAPKNSLSASNRSPALFRPIQQQQSGLIASSASSSSPSLSISPGEFKEGQAFIANLGHGQSSASMSQLSPMSASASREQQLREFIGAVRQDATRTDRQQKEVIKLVMPSFPVPVQTAMSLSDEYLAKLESRISSALDQNELAGLMEQKQYALDVFDRNRDNWPRRWSGSPCSMFQLTHSKKMLLPANAYAQKGQEQSNSRRKANSRVGTERNKQHW